MLEGTIKFWNKKNYGFIRPDDLGEDAFVHIDDVSPRDVVPRVGDRVRYEQHRTDKGLRAYNVELLKSADAGSI